MNTESLTTKELAEKMGVEYATALAVAKWLEAKGLVTVEGTRPNPAGRGKGSTVFKIPLGEITLKLI
jgi:Mn-dependent DtxR family transcriptional regulator